ncbi:peptidoglycan-binding protein [Alicyclobacillus vulcanalis]|uniref:peptidoglycan-binding protein n=1 Tax=Alicyclobacillus vulcanalis TaxID=252246 RepID=UPI001F38EDA3|nr:peptidoglycan-binding protein [Alicyclobacillus vulcanalis]
MFVKTHRLLAVAALPATVLLTTPAPALAETSSSQSASAPSLNVPVAALTLAGVQSYPMLSYGSTGVYVEILQNALNALGYDVGQASGLFDATTQAEVKAFQQAMGLQTDGIVGPLTWGALAKAVADYRQVMTVLSSRSSLVQQVEWKRIVWNGRLISKPIGFTYQGTAYMPIWYVMQALSKAGIASTWQGGVWTLTPPGGQTVNYGKISYGPGSAAIAIGQTVVANVPAVVYPDPASGKLTTFMPVWYVMNALQRLGIGSTWQGTEWDMKPAPVVIETGDPSNNTTGSDPANSTGNGTGNSTGNATGAVPGGNTVTNVTTGSSNVTGNSTGNSLGNSTGNSLGNSTSNATGNATGNTTGNATGNSTGTSSGSFTNVDLRYPAPSNINAQSINQFLLQNSSPLNGLGNSFMDAQNLYSVDANYLVSHAILESAWGQSQIALQKNNLFGYGAYDSNPGQDAGVFPSDDYAIRFEAWTVRMNYLTPGASLYVTPTLSGMNVNYATAKTWASGIAAIMTQFASSVGSNVNAYVQYTPSNNPPAPRSTAEPVYYMNGAQGVTQQDPYYPNGGVPYYPTIAQGENQQFFGQLSVGSFGQPVVEVQQFLNRTINAGLTVDGQFGPLTQAAVEKFQSQVMHMSNPNGIWTFSMWVQYIQPSQSNANLIPAGTTVKIDQVAEGMAGPYVVPWYHVVGYGWVDSQYIKLTNVYRVIVQNPAGTATTIPVYQVGNLSSVLLNLHSGDWVVANSAQPSGGVYTIQIAAQDPTVSNGYAAGTLLTGFIPANGTVSLVPQN